MNIMIGSVMDALRATANNKNINLVSIFSGRDKKRLLDLHGIDFDEEMKDCTNMLRLSFDDVFGMEEDSPSKEDVRKAIEWCKDRKNVMVHCFAGMSRSSALAYVIACSQMPVDHALQVINLKVHCPNDLIVSLGSDILGNKKMVKKLEKKEKQTRQQWMSIQ